jgi:hypothetical protein
VDAERAAFVATATTSASTHRTTTPTTTPDLESGGLSTGAKAGIGVGVSLGILISLGVILFLWRRRKRANMVIAGSPAQHDLGNPELDGKELVAGGGMRIEVNRESEKTPELHSHPLPRGPAHELYTESPSDRVLQPNSAPSEVRGTPITNSSRSEEIAIPPESSGSIPAPATQHLPVLATNEQLTPREMELKRLELEEEKIRQRRFELQGPQ